jgi:hypothetical protein
MRIAAVSMMITLLLSLSASAFAQTSPSAQGYNRELGVIGEIEQVQPPAEDNVPAAQPTPPQPAPQAAEGDLPFTGLELSLVALMGVALLGTGIVLRRASRKGDSPV